MAKKLVLGKGLASLINPNIAGEVLAKMNAEDENIKSEYNDAYLIETSLIKTNPNQPRKVFKESELEELSLSIKENGIIQPLIVAKTENGFELIAGERRLRAAKKIGMTKVPVVFKNGTDREKMIMSIIENVQRSNLNCVEEALAYFQLMEDFKLTQDEVAKKLGKERSTVANFLRVLKLPREVIGFLNKELLTFGHGKVLAAEKDREKIIRVANEAVLNKLSVREVEKLLKSNRAQKIIAKANPYMDDKVDQYRIQLEKKTGFHFALKSKKNGAGEISIKFNNEAEFNDIYDYFLTK